jgi:hypothetical protein
MVLVSRRLEDLKKGLGLGLVSKVLGLGLDKIVLVLVLKKGLVDSTGFTDVFFRINSRRIANIYIFITPQGQRQMYKKL